MKKLKTIKIISKMKEECQTCTMDIKIIQGCQIASQVFGDLIVLILWKKNKKS